VNAQESRGIKKPLVLWTICVIAVTVLIPLGSSLAGLRTFFPADLVQVVDPWSQSAPPGFRRANPLVEDPLNADMPMLAEYRRRLSEGDYPLWSSDPSGGIPLGTTATRRSLSPFTVPYLLLPLWYAPAVVKLLEMAAAVVFTFLFLRRIGLTAHASLVGGIIYMSSGFQVVWTNWPQSHIGALIPGLFWAGELLVQRRTLRAMIPASIITAVILLEGYPPVAGYALIAAGIYMVARVAQTRQPGTGERLAVLERFGAAIMLGAGVAALQVLPFLNRLGELDIGYRQQASGSHLPLRALVTLVFPNAFGSPVDGSYFGDLHFQRTSYVVLNYQELQGFIGAAALVLILVAATRVRRGGVTADRLPPGVRAYLWIGVGVLAALIYVGGPPLRALQATPLFHLAFIGRLRAVMGFLLAVLAAIGVQAVADEAKDGARRARMLTAGVLAAVAVVGAFGLKEVWQLAAEAHQRRHLAHQALVPVLSGGVALALAGLGPWPGLGRMKIAGHRVVLWVLPVLISVESLAFALPFWPRVPKALFYPTTPAHRFLQEHLGEERMASGAKAMYPGTPTFYGLRSLNAHAFVDPAWRRLITVADPGAYTPVRPTWALLDTNRGVVTSSILDRLSVRYFANPLDAPVLGQRVAVSAPFRDVVLRPGSSVTAPLPGGRIRAVAVQVIRGFLGSGEQTLRAEIFDESGRMVSEGSRRMEPPDEGSWFEIPVVESAAEASSGRPWSVRVSMTGKGPLLLAADRTGAPALTEVMGEQDGLRLVFATGVAIYERLDALSRIRWAERATVIRGPSARFRALGQGVASNTVVLSQTGPPGSGDGAELRILEDSGDRVRVAVNATGAGYLVVADAMQDGWSASVDGQPAVLRPADHAVVAVFVPAGRHEVSMRYDPQGWRVGQLISVVSVILLLALALSGRPARRLLRKSRA